MHGAATSVFAPPEDWAARNATVPPPRYVNSRLFGYDPSEAAAWWVGRGHTLFGLINAIPVRD